jgi:hypothetical protein
MGREYCRRAIFASIVVGFQVVSLDIKCISQELNNMENYAPKKRKFILAPDNQYLCLELMTFLTAQ